MTHRNCKLIALSIILLFCLFSSGVQVMRGEEARQRRSYPGDRYDRWAYEFDDDDDGYWPDDYFGLFGREPRVHGVDGIFGDLPRTLSRPAHPRDKPRRGQSVRSNRTPIQSYAYEF